MDGNSLQNLEKFKLPIALSILGLVLVIGGIITSGLNKQKPKSLPSSGADFPKESLVAPVKNISVDVSGAVKKPGVYQLTDGSRIDAAITAAGGFSDQANKQYISKYLNMAQKISDGTKVYVPAEGEEAGSASSSAVAGVAITGKININSGSESEIESLPAVGPVTAGKIISERPYQQIEDLLSKKIVSKSVFEKIKDLVVLY